MAGRRRVLYVVRLEVNMLEWVNQQGFTDQLKVRVVAH